MLPPPELGQHTEEVLLTVGYDWEELGALREQSRGLRIEADDVDEFLGDALDPSMVPETTVLDVRGLVIPRGDILL